MKVKRALSWVLLVSMLVSMFGTGAVATDTVEAPQETPAVVEPIAEPEVSPEPQPEPLPVVEETPTETSEESEELTSPAETPEETPEATEIPEETPAEAPAETETPTETGEEVITVTTDSIEASMMAASPPQWPDWEEEEETIFDHSFGHLDMRVNNNSVFLRKYYINENNEKVYISEEYVSATITGVNYAILDGVTYDDFEKYGTGEFRDYVSPGINITANSSVTFSVNMVANEEPLNGVTATFGYDRIEQAAYDCNGYRNGRFDGLDFHMHTGEYFTFEVEVTEREVAVEKVWSDSDNQDGIRPTSVTVNLLSNGSVYDTVVLSSSNGWSHEFTGLPTKDSSGNGISYTVEEVVPAGYTQVTTGNAASGYVITNTHTPEVTSISGSKTWNDNNNQDGKRPTSITINLLADGVQVHSQQADADDGWSWKFDNLPVYNAGNKIVYTIQEVTIDGYTTTYNGYNVTNTHVPEVVEISGSKTWNDDNDRDGKRPDSITIGLYRTGVTDPIATKIVTAADGWKWDFGDLPKYENGVEIDYYILEVAVPHYSTQIDGFNITNTYTPETVTVAGSKTWDDNNDQDGLRPDSITIILLADGEEVDRKTVTAADNWSGSFTNLPRYRDGGIEIVYTIDEVPVEGYTTAIHGYNVRNTHIPETTTIYGSKAWVDENDQDGLRPHSITVTLMKKVGNQVSTVKSLTISYEGDGWQWTFDNLPVYENGVKIEYYLTENAVPGYTTEIDGYDITNTHTPATVRVSGAKTWVDNNNQDGIRPGSITINLLANGDKVDSVTVTEEDGWAWSFDNLPKYENGVEIVYTIDEDAVAGYTKTISGYNITNAHEPEVRDITVTKVWDDQNNKEGLRPASITVNLLADGEQVDSKVISGSGSATFKDLPVYANGTKINYTVEEAKVDHYTTSVDNTNLESGSVVITNTRVPTTVTLTANKVWDDENNAAGKRPASITLYLLGNGQNLYQYYSTNEDVKHLADKYKVTVTADPDGNWSYTWTDLEEYFEGQKVSYSVHEAAIYDANGAVLYNASYAVDGSEVTITNTYDPDHTEVAVQKIWNDNYDQDGIRPASIDVVIYQRLVNLSGVEQQGYTAYTTGTLNETNGWYYWEDLPAYAYDASDNIIGQYEYKVEEASVPEGYTLTSTTYNETTNTWVITNTHVPATVDVSGAKTWVDNNNQDGIRPGSITINLLADGVKIDSAVVTANDGWAWSFEDLPEYQNGKKITYTVTENEVAGYTTNVDGYNVTNTHTPETTEITVNKVWNDNNDQDGFRPASVTVNLLANGTVVDSAVINGSGSTTFEDLPVYENGKAINYTVEEVEVDKYTSSVGALDNGAITVTNTHEPIETQMKISKTWVDENGDPIPADEIPYSITLHLMGNNQDLYKYYTENPTAGHDANKYKVVLSAANADPDGDRTWTYTWSGLAAYFKGSAVSYSVWEEPIYDANGAMLYNATYHVETDGTISIVNKYDPDHTEVAVTKIWEDNYDQDGLRPDYIKVDLLRQLVDLNGDVVEAYKVVDTAYLAETSGTYDGFEAEYSLWNHYWNGLSAYTYDKDHNITGMYVYKVEEVGTASGYTQTGIEYDSDINLWTITNTHTPATVSVSGEKIWDDNDNQDGFRPNSITINLLADGTQVDSVTVTEADGWKWSFTDLPQNAGGKEITYTIAENEIIGYTAEVDGYDVTNTHTPETVDISGSKTWNDGNNQDGLRPDNITINLLADGTQVASLAVTEEDGWKWSFSDLPKYKDGKEIVYTITEDAVSGYFAKVDGYNVTNTHTPETVDITGSKTWNDNHDQDGIRPASITVELFADGVKVHEQHASLTNNWSWSFEDLPKFKDGAEIKYTIKEITVSGYTTTYDGYNIINTHVPYTIDIFGTKLWEDNNDNDGKRPDSVTIELYRNNEETPVATAEATKNGAWKWAFDDLPVYTDGELNDYYVVEVVVDKDNKNSYSTVISSETSWDYTEADFDKEYTVTNSRTGDTVTIAGSKTWNDNNNQDGKRPASITINLLADGEKIDSLVVTPDADGVWKGEFTGLPRYKDGKEIVYTISEEPVEGYTTAVHGYNIVNTHVPETVTVSGSKTWNDNNNQDGIRPHNIAITLMKQVGNAEAVAVETRWISETDGWKWTFSDLPKYENGKEIVYTIAEAEIEGYDTTISGYNITNTHTPATVSVSGAKTWDDNDDQDGKRPESITINLFANGKKVDSVTVTKTDGWKWTFSDLPKFENGKEITYTITENEVSGYTSEISGYDVTNTHEPQQTAIKVTKVWNDAEDQDGMRTASVTVRLWANGTEKESVVLSQANGWTHTFTGLDVYSNGNEINYTVTEAAVDNYTMSITGDKDTGFTVTNTHKPETVEISGKKTWDDNNNQDGLRPASLTVELYANGVKVHEQHASEANNWSWSFVEMPKYAAGEEIVYEVKEVTVDGYVSTVAGYDITNTHEPYTLDIRGEKVWEDDDNRDGKRPQSIVITLYRNDQTTAVDSKVVTADENWKFEFKDLPAYDGGTLIDYYIVETIDSTSQTADGIASHELSDYSTKIESQYKYDNTTGWSKEYVVTNTYSPETVVIAGSKTWVDGFDVDGVRPESITIILMADDKEVNRLTVTEADGWKGEFKTDSAGKALPRYKDGGKLIEYTVEEVMTEEMKAAGYTSVVHGYNIVNTRTPETVTVSGSKTWDDGEDQDGIRPHHIEVTLLADGEKVETRWINEADGWKWTFSDLPKYTYDEDGNGGHLIEYTIAENTIDGYETTIDDYNITNTHTPEVIDISGFKTWDDADDQDGIRPDAIVINLLANGEKVDSKTVTAKDGWKWTFAGVDKYADGQEIVYTITEEAVDGYTQTVADYNVTNTHEPEVTSIRVFKEWNDDENRDNLRPESIIVKLMANGKDTGKTVVLTEENGWTELFVELPVNEAGKKIEYTVVEAEVDGYEAAYRISEDGSVITITNTHEIETTEITVKKLWKDNDDADGIRPESVKIQLLAGGEKVGEAVEVKDTYTWTNLPVNEDGEAIVYTVEEIDTPKGYEPKYSDLKAGVITITNCHEQETTDIKVTKTWVDNNDAKKARPKNITVQLYANGVEYGAAVTITSDMKWEYTFEDLPANKGGEPIKYTVKEAGVKHYIAKYTVGNNNVLVIKNTYTDIPLTGDTINMLLWSIIGGSAMLSLGGVTVIAKRKKFVK